MKPGDNSKFVCIVSPKGKGAISVVEIVGSGVLDHFANHFTGTLNKPNKAYYGDLKDGHSRIDEIIARYVPGTQSFSGLDTIQISCHASPVIQDQVVKLFVGRGFCEISHQGYLDIALSNKKIDRIQHEALSCIQNALTRVAALVLNDQINGALSKAIGKSNDLHPLLNTAAFGTALTSSFQITIIGAPNAGKSTLFNKLLQKERALVFHEKGTTRDPVKDYLSIKGIPFILCDTAGVDKPDDKLEELSIDRTLKQIKGSDLLIHLFDGTRPLQDPEIKLRNAVSGKNIISVLNKIDAGSFRFDTDICTSALNNTGVDDLRQKILDKFSINPAYVEGSPVVFTKRQVEIIKDHPAEKAKLLLLDRVS